MLKILLSEKVLGPIIIVFTMSIVYLSVNKAIKRIFFAKNKIEIKRARTLASLFNNLLKYFLIIIGIIMILNIYGVNTTAFVTSLGALSLVAGLALQDVLKDLLSGISIILENQYGIGDVVTINGNKGEVISLGLKTTKLKTYTGEIVFISNRNIEQVINHSIANSLLLIDIGLPYEEEIEKIENVLNDLFKNYKSEYLKTDISLLGIEKLDSSSVVFRITAETIPMKHYELRRDLLKQIKEELDRNNISIPYNQLVIHNGI